MASGRNDAASDGPCLVVKGGATDGEVYTLSEGMSILVGSGRLASLQIAGSEIGAAHLRITWDDSGISVTDNGSMGGTFVNGEPVVTGPLSDGDRISFVPAKSKVKLPELLVRIRRGSVMAVAPPAPEPLTSPAPAERPKPAGMWAPASVVPPVSHRPKKAAPPPWEAALTALQRIDWRSATVLGPLGGIALLLVGWVVLRLVLGHTPILAAVQPATGEPGQVVALSGEYFGEEAGKSTVRFGDVIAKVVAGNATGLTVTVPEVPQAASGQAVAVTVETRGGRSKPASFRLTRTPHATALEPGAALPGETVTLRGQSLSGAVTVTVGGAAARILEGKDDFIRFQVPGLPPTPPRAEAVVVTVGDRISKGMDLIIGKPPLILEVVPPRGDSGDRVAIRGVGFSSEPAQNRVAFAGAPALVLGVTATELRVAAPAVPPGQDEVEVQIEVEGHAAANRATFTYTRPSSASFRPRFVPADAGATRAQAFVSTQLGPLLLLSDKDQSASVQDRAVDVASALDVAFAAAALSFEARTQPAPGVGVVGNPALLVRVTGDDAAGYEAPASVGFKNPRPTPAALAGHWAALLSDYATLFLEGQRPVRLLAISPRGRAFVDLQSELGWRPGTPVATGRAGALSPDLLRRLREMALGLGRESAATAGAALEGTWEGELQETSGTQKPITVRLRQAAGKLVGSLTTGGRLALEQPIEAVSAQADALTFSVRLGATVRVFVGRLDSTGITGTVHSATATGPSLGTFSLKYAP